MFLASNSLYLIWLFSLKLWKSSALLYQEAAAAAGMLLFHKFI
jgi:hypothetical protein